MSINNIYGADNMPDAKAFMKAKEVVYDAAQELIDARGDVVITWQEYSLQADQVTYSIKDDSVIASGNVRIEDNDGRVLYGQKAIVHDRFKEAILENFSARFERDAVFAARHAVAKNASNITMDRAIFTACTSYCKRSQPIWQIKAKKINIDRKAQVVKYQHLFFEIYGVPVLFMPYLRHPTPHADAKSGALMPRIESNAVAVPIYGRLQPNLDFTITPRVGEKYILTEGELRHKLIYGSYLVKGSVGNSGEAMRLPENQAPDDGRRFYLDAKGDFAFNKLAYGFHVKRTSDKAYLLNYHNLLDPYLVSNLYANVFDERGLIALNAFHFQDLYSAASKINEPMIFPHSAVNYFIPLNDSESTLLTLNNDFVFFSNYQNLEMVRNAAEIGISNSHITDFGQILQSGIYNRRDDYFWRSNIPNVPSRYYTRNLPEASLDWSWPFVRPVREYSIYLTPRASAVIGREYSSKIAVDNVVHIDPKSFELYEYNLFKRNKSISVDGHEYGKRLSYGATLGFDGEDLNYENFFGTLENYRHNHNQRKREYIMRNGLRFKGVTFFVSHKYNSNFSTINRDIGLGLKIGTFSGDMLLSNLNNKYGYYNDYEMPMPQAKISQLAFAAENRFTENFSLGGSSCIDLSEKSSKILIRSFQATYEYDCVKLKMQIVHKMLHDSRRGISGKKSIGFVVGLKVINM